MRIADLKNSFSDAALGYDFSESYKLRKELQAAADTNRGEALQKAEETQDANDRTTFQMMDRHNEMVKKSQELYDIKAKQRAIERRNKENREEQSALLAEMALRNAERSESLQSLQEQGR